MLRKKLKLDVETSPQSSTPVELHTPQVLETNISERFLNLEVALNDSLKKLSFKQPVVYVYRPLDYAFKPHSVFTHRYCTTPKKILFVGMNPGPWGMCQTGIPFGEVNVVKDWFQINDEVSKPEKECPERVVSGLSCKRSEVSGQRIWGLFRNICGTPEKFFKHAYMYNYCPIAMMKIKGVNVTPSEIKGETQRLLEEICDKTLYDVIQLLQVEIVVTVGKFAEARALHVLKHKNPFKTKVLYLMHPNLSKEQEEFMEIAFKFAHEALDAQEVPVGCIFVHNNLVIATGRNTVNETRNATRHAEINCIDQVNTHCKTNSLDRDKFFSEICVFVTVEPCIMCAAALYDLNIKCIVYGCRNDRFGGSTVFDVASVLNPTTQVVGGYKAEEAMNLLKNFYRGTNPSAPLSKVKVKNKSDKEPGCSAD
ncbi:hypothetical protein FQA39_LY02711 [Lamprigera yunnana]|nr:hypothetical protein FQA39_LY02711 [Lamprigera yunnana]